MPKTTKPKSTVKTGEKATQNELGMSFDVEGKFQSINFNILVKYIIKKREIVVDENGNYYWYIKKQNIWVRTNASKICKQIRHTIHKKVPNIWQSRYSHEVKDALFYEAKHVSKLKEAKDYINLENGLFNLKTMELQEHTSEIFSTCQLPFEYDEEAECPNFKDFMEKLTLGDDELKSVIQEIMGYVLTHRVDAQKFFIFWSAGSSGKSTLCDVFVWLAGEENVSTVSLGALSDKFARSQIEGKILNIATENETRKVKTALLKQIVGGDVIQIETKGKDPHTYKPYVKCVFAVNNLPQFCENSYGMLRRMQIVPFPAVFTDNPNPDNKNEFQRIPNFQAKLEPELAGIFNFAMEGYKRLRDNDFVFTKSQRIDEVTKEYTKQYSPVREFVGECLVKSNREKRMYKHTLYKSFQKWSNDNDLDNPFYNIRGFLAEIQKQFPHFGLIYEDTGSNGKPYKSGGKPYIRGISFKKNDGEELLNDD